MGNLYLECQKTIVKFTIKVFLVQKNIFKNNNKFILIYKLMTKKYTDFYDFYHNAYKPAHQHPTNRKLHVFGTVLAFF